MDIINDGIALFHVFMDELSFQSVLCILRQCVQ
jgi:hypothetical protein